MAPEYDELLILAQTLGEVKTKTDKLEAEFATQAKPFEAATSALYSAISGIKALQFHVLDNNLGKLSTRVEEMRQAINEQVGVIALELKKADAENATKAGQDADSLRAAIADVQANLGTLANQFVAQLQRVEFEAKEEAKKLQLIPGPAGAAGASLNPRGTFVDGETYNRLDVVSWLGSSYIAAVDGVTEKPSKNSNQWQVLASRGSGGAGGAGDFGSLAGVAQINQGGTGQTTRAAGLNALLPSQTGAVQYMLLTDGAGTVSWGAQPVAGLPSQTSNGGKLLTTDGTNASWSNAVTVSGSNATVTGTLSSAGNLSVTGTSAQIILGQSSGSALTYLIRPAQAGGAIQIVQDSATVNRWLSLGGCDNLGVYSELMRVAGATGNILVTSTVASTTTSTGALVVGNGTSGGLGVGGSINAGGNVTISGSNGYAVIGGRQWSFRANSSGGSPASGCVIRDDSAAADRLTIDINGNTTVGGTLTSTTSTDSGVLQLNLVNSSTGTSASSLFRFNAGTRTVTLQAYNDTHATLAGQLRVGTSNGDIVLIPSGVVQATFGPSSTTFASGNVTLTDPAGSILCTGTGNTTATKVLQFTRSDNADVSAFGLTGSAYAGGLAGLGSNETYIYSAAPFRVFIGTAATNRYDFTSSQFKINATTASTTTSSGALVVSGGVGVAKRIHSGEGLTTGGDNETHISFVRNGTVTIGPTSSAAPKLSISSAVVLAAATQSLAAWGDIGAQFAVSGSVLTDTQSSGTVSRCVLNSFASTNVACAGATTFTQAATLFVAGGPTAGTNVTITNAYAIYTAGGRINFQGLPTSAAGLQAGTLWNDAGTLKVA